MPNYIARQMGLCQMVVGRPWLWLALVTVWKFDLQLGSRRVRRRPVLPPLDPRIGVVDVSGGYQPVTGAGAQHGEGGP